jgi:predicted ArsR family transcriptional regulator
MHGLDAVAHPVRLRIVRHLADNGPASLGELARAAGVHENTARSHVIALQEGGVISAERRPLDRPGRPGVNYRLVDEHLIAPSALAHLLAAALDRSGPDDEQLRATGRDWGRYLAGRPGSHEVETKLPEVLEQLGYQCRVDGDAVRLSGCPCRSVLPGRSRLICCLAEGVVDGALEAASSRRRVASAEHDPEARRCRLELE